MQPFCWGPLRVRWADRMLLADFLRPDTMPIRLEQTLFLLMLAIHTPSQMNTNAGLELRGRGGHTPEVKARKRGPPSDSEDLEHLNKRLRHSLNFCEVLKAKEDRKRLAQFDDEKGDEDASFIKRMCLCMSGEFARSDGDSIVP